jgi:hypothetical protein
MCFESSRNSVAVTHTTLDNRICFGCVQYRMALAGVTINQIYKVLVWSFKVLASGFHPREDHTGKPFSETGNPQRFRLGGQPLAAGFVGAWSEFRCDWKYMAETFLFKQMWSANYVCHLCRAHVSIKRLLFTDFNRDANVRRTRMKPTKAHYDHNLPLMTAQRCHIWFA